MSIWMSSLLITWTSYGLFVSLQYLAFSCGLVRGGLSNLGVKSIVTAEVSVMPACKSPITHPASNHRHSERLLVIMETTVWWKHISTTLLSAVTPSTEEWEWVFCFLSCNIIDWWCSTSKILTPPCLYSSEYNLLQIFSRCHREVFVVWACFRPCPRRLCKIWGLLDLCMWQHHLGHLQYL